RRPARCRACERAQAPARSRTQPHLASASLVRGEPLIARKSKARLVHLARPCPGWRSAEQLALRIWGHRLGIRPDNEAVLLPRLLDGTAGPELAQSRSARRDLRGNAVLARARSRWLPRGRRLASVERCAIS